MKHPFWHHIIFVQSSSLAIKIRYEISISILCDCQKHFIYIFFRICIQYIEICVTTTIKRVNYFDISFRKICQKSKITIPFTKIIRYCKFSIAISKIWIFQSIGIAFVFGAEAYTHTLSVSLWIKYTFATQQHLINFNEANRNSGANEQLIIIDTKMVLKREHFDFILYDVCCMLCVIYMYI